MLSGATEDGSVCDSNPHPRGFTKPNSSIHPVFTALSSLQGTLKSTMCYKFSLSFWKKTVQMPV